MLAKHNEYFSKFSTFPLYGTTPEKMSQIKAELLSSGSIKRIFKTKISEEKGRWLIETITTKQHAAQKHCDEVITNFTSDLNPDFKPTRIDPELASEELMMQYLEMGKVYRCRPNIIKKYTSDLNPGFKITRIDSELANKELMMLSLEMEENYPDVNKKQQPPFKMHHQDELNL